MQFSIQFTISIAVIIGLLLSECTALPINVTANGNANDLFIGLLALICLSVIIAACTCCHRNKSGFEEFENETTLAEQTIRSEFPIFRAISPQLDGHQLSSDNADNPGNRILSNIVNQNHMNRTFNDFENNQNNNGPISPADLENIQNNNAIDYIPNRNEIDVIVEPSAHSINRNLAEANETPVTFEDVGFAAVPLRNVESEFNNTAAYHQSIRPIVINSNWPHLQIPMVKSSFDQNEVDRKFDETIDIDGYYDSSHRYRQNTIEVQNTLISVEKNEIKELNFVNENKNETFANHESPAEKTSEYYIDQHKFDKTENIKDSACVIKMENDSERQPQHPKNEVKNQLTIDDINSVEEALRALDFAISGGDSLLSDYHDDNENDFDESGDDIEDEEIENDVKGAKNCLKSDPKLFDNENDLLHKNEDKQTNDQKTVFNGFDECSDVPKLNLLEECVKSTENSRHSLNKSVLSHNDVYEEAKFLVDSIIETCQNTIFLSRMDTCINEGNCSDEMRKSTRNVLKNDASLPQNADTIILNKLENSNMDDSMNETFAIGKLEASTPCIKTNLFAHVEPKKSAAELFPKLDEANESNVSDDCCEMIQKTLPIAGDVTFDAEFNQMNFTATFTKVNEQTFTAPMFTVLNEGTFCVPADKSNTNRSKTEPNRMVKVNPTIKIDREEATSDDLTTITPMNTPIELNYVGESWDSIVSKSMNRQKVADKTQVISEPSANMTFCTMEASGSGSAWFLHPPLTNATYNMDETDVHSDDDDGNESIEENVELLSSTFDALRKQLAEALPHASGNISAPLDFSDDDGDDGADDDDDDCENPGDQSRERCDDLQAEVVINYKRQLSPIMEESEDETYKTFIMNETKCLDSTSTGCMESGEAIMGVTKVLMASNDTLFNFEDTLGDRDDMFSPRNTSNSGSNTASSNTPQPINCKTPTNDNIYLHLPDHKALESTDRQQSIIDAKSNLIPFNFETIENKSPTNIVADLLSPEQAKTFSEEINTGDQLSSDLSATVDATTNTLDDLKTCISVHSRDDVEDILNENSDAAFADLSISCANNPNGGQNLDTDKELDMVNGIDYEANEINIKKAAMDLSHVEEDDDCDKESQCIESKNTQADSEKSQNNKCSTDYGHGNHDDAKNNESSPMMRQQYMADFLTKEIEFSSGQTSFDRKTTLEPIESTKENKSPNSKSHNYKNMTVKHIHATNLKEDRLNESEHYNADVIFRTHEPKSDFYRTNDKIVIDLCQHMPMHNNFAICEIDTQNEQNCLVASDDITGQLSGEEDPWAHPIADIRFTGPCSEVMSTSFTANDWDSDIEDSNSSEEFMYVKGTPRVAYLQSPVSNTFPMKKKSNQQQQQQKHQRLQNGVANEAAAEFEDDLSELVAKNTEQPDIHSIWNSHEDQIAVSSNVDKNSTDNVLDEGSSSDFEGEWVPSSWDSLAQPSRSALKSPDKSSSKTANKNRRNVAFKKQNYHSVYEYPKEIVTLSPALSEPQMWRTFSSSNSSAYGLNSEDENNLEFNGVEGFAISSSTRPFHGSQFNAQCHTWPTDSDFSWSQVQGDNETSDKFPSYSSISIEWPKNLSRFYSSNTKINDDENNEFKNVEIPRPDSGVGESAELLSESISLGDLCHTKSSLRLPLNVFPAAGITTNINTENPCQNAISSTLTSDSIDSTVPTSCTGSMDSLSSSSSSNNSNEHQMDLKTLTKFPTMPTIDHRKDVDISEQQHRKQNLSDDMKMYVQNTNELNTIFQENNSRPEDSLIFDCTDVQQSGDVTNTIKRCDSRPTSNRQSDSTDEDSGIESIIRIAKEM